MPIITFLKDIFAAAKGCYHRTVGRHTQQFCTQAAKLSRNGVQKKIFFVTAICADEFIAALIGVDAKRPVGAFRERKLKPRLSAREISAALRIYISGILTLTSLHKTELLAKAELQEQELLQAWCRVFGYLPADMEVFDTVLLPAYQQGGITALSNLVGTAVLEQLFLPAGGAMSPEENAHLEQLLLEDATAVIRLVQSGREVSA